MCGATCVSRLDRWSDWGLSPRVRGNREAFFGLVPAIGPIPACAGQPGALVAVAVFFGAYPRVCGATAPVPGFFFSYVGLSPRVRGNRGHGLFLRCSDGPIPACAGQPIKQTRHARHKRAYPRVCGATLTAACLLRSARAYPRVCGATNNLCPMKCIDVGLSPRVRGNLAGGILIFGGERPIPACAGQPYVGALWLVVSAAYPRVCGATNARRVLRLLRRGLSPRVRGNLLYLTH